jgi:mRNA-degrading endonuclease RelE of RelBE toxin-antitoxin system
MKTRVELSEQVVRFVGRQAPEPRRSLRAGLRGLEREQGDVKALEGPLRDYFRLRVRGYRIIFAYETAAKRQRLIRCIFAERRNAVYEFFEEMLRKQLLAGEER